jgi:hypothetical protein
MWEITSVEHRDDGDDTVYVQMSLRDAIWSAGIIFLLGALLF